MFGSTLYDQLGLGEIASLSVQTPQRVDVPPCKQVSCGEEFSICLSCDGEIYGFGSNRNGNLGLGSSADNYDSPQKLESLKHIDFVECSNYFTFCKDK